MDKSCKLNFFAHLQYFWLSNKLLSSHTKHMTCDTQYTLGSPVEVARFSCFAQSGETSEWVYPGMAPIAKCVPHCAPNGVRNGGVQDCSQIECKGEYYIGKNLNRRTHRATDARTHMKVSRDAGVFRVRTKVRVRARVRGLDNWTDIQDAHLVKFAVFVFAMLACDWLSFSPTLTLTLTLTTPTS